MSQKEIKVSLFASAIRVNQWMEWYESLKAQNETPFEVVFAGPTTPSYKLPDNFRFIRTDVKPAQCSEIAMRNSRGAALMQVVDDLKYSPHAIDLMFEEIQKTPKTLATCHYFYGSDDHTKTQNAMGIVNSRLPFLPVCGMFLKDILSQSKGIDRRYRAVFWELDLYMRLCVYFGYQTRFVDATCTETDADNKNNERLSHRFWSFDRKLFLTMWNIEAYTAQAVPQLQRLWQFEGYEDTDLLEISQSME